MIRAGLSPLEHVLPVFASKQIQPPFFRCVGSAGTRFEETPVVWAKGIEKTQFYSLEYEN
jgi:hypothetical protein